MWIDNDIFREDMAFIAQSECIDWAKFENQTILVTGATGLIGYTVVSALLYANEVRRLNLRVIALVRDLAKARERFASQIKDGASLIFAVGSVERLPELTSKIDYIIHGASPTASAFFIEKPVETIQIAVQGTMNLLELAVRDRVKSFAYLSSMEVYGAPQTDDVIEETQGTTLDTMAVRSSYPEAKRLCESLCSAYYSEYGVSTKAVRLAQTFGPGVPQTDIRVFAEFARCALNEQDIVLQTVGTSKRCYLYTADAVTAILTILSRGDGGNAYNAANADTYCNIVEMAHMVADKLANNKIKVVVPQEGHHNKKFPPIHRLNLGTAKLEQLGWQASRDLQEMYGRMIATF